MCMLLCYSEGETLLREPQFTAKWLVVGETGVLKYKLDSGADELKL